MLKLGDMIFGNALQYQSWNFFFKISSEIKKCNTGSWSEISLFKSHMTELTLTNNATQHES